MTQAEATIFHLPVLDRANNRKRTVAVSCICAAVIVAVAVAGALLAPAAMESDLAARSQAPSLEHPFGTDQLGRDMLLRTVAGLSTSIGIGLLAACVSSVVALVLGAAAALGGRRVDAAVTWLIDLMMGIPHIVLLLLISFALGKGFWGVAVGIALTHWPSLARVVRAEVLQVKQSTYISVAAALGTSRVRIAVRHILPAVLPQFLVGLILLFPHAILHEAAITFLGFGLSARDAGDRRHPERVDGIPVGGRLVARVLPGAGARGGGHAVRRGGAVRAPSGGPASGAEVGGRRR